MSKHDHEPIYNQQDMDSVLSRLREVQKENEQAYQLLWAAVHAAGGEVAIPHKVMIEGDHTREIIFWDDPVTFTMRLKVKDV